MAGDGGWVCVAPGLVPLWDTYVSESMAGLETHVQTAGSVHNFALNPPGEFESGTDCVQEGFIYSLHLCCLCGKKNVLYRVFSSSIT